MMSLLDRILGRTPRTANLDKERLQGLRDELLLVEGAGAGSVDPSVLQSARPPGIHDDLLACAQLAHCVFDRN